MVISFQGKFILNKKQKLNACINPYSFSKFIHISFPEEKSPLEAFCEEEYTLRKKKRYSKAHQETTGCNTFTKCSTITSQKVELLSLDILKKRKKKGEEERKKKKGQRIKNPSRVLSTGQEKMVFDFGNGLLILFFTGTEKESSLDY